MKCGKSDKLLKFSNNNLSCIKACGKTGLDYKEVFFIYALHCRMDNQGALEWIISSLHGAEIYGE